MSGLARDKARISVFKNKGAVLHAILLVVNENIIFIA
jgi:hypothetical protein